MGGGNLKWKFSNWNSKIGFKCLSGGSVWICHWNANHFPCNAVHWGIKININFDIRHIKTSTFSANMWGFCKGIYSACIHSLFMFICGCLMIALFRVGSCVSVESFDGLQLNSLKCSCFTCNECLQTPWLSLPGPPAVCKQLGHCHFESESHRTSWWPSGSNFLPHLSPQVLQPILYYGSLLHSTNLSGIINH